jgi:hypothetical protein
MQGTEANLDPIGGGIAFAKLIEGQVRFLAEDDLQEQLTFVRDDARAPGATGLRRQLAGLDEELLEAMDGRRADAKDRRGGADAVSLGHG